MTVRKAFLKQAKETLLDMKSQVLRGIREDLKEDREGQKDEGRDTYDVASEERDREQVAHDGLFRGGGEEQRAAGGEHEHEQHVGATAPRDLGGRHRVP